MSAWLEETTELDGVGGGPVTELHRLTASQQLDGLRAGEIGAVELTEHYLSRIAEHNSALGAYITVPDDVARAEAEAAQQRLSAGGDDLPALLGLPVPIKDLAPTAGVLTTMGSRAMADFVPQEDSWTVGLVRGAGAVMIGKTNTPEFGPTCYTENDLDVATAVTPYDLARYASGSSGGAAAAVAAGLAPVAHGSDGGGSVRSPASACGLVGYKPSRGTTSLHPITTFTSIAVEGPLARTLDDAALLADVMMRTPPGELWPDPRPAGAPSLRAALRGPSPSGLRIAWWSGTGVPGVEPHPAAVAGAAQAVEALRATGHRVEEIEVPFTQDGAVLDAILMRFGLAIGTINTLLPEERRDLLRPLSKWFLDWVHGSSGVDIALSDAVFAAFATSVRERLAPYDAVVCPTTSGPPVPLGWFSAEGPAAEGLRMIGWSSGTPFANAAGYCALSLPLGWTDDALPVGTQIAMAPGRDHELFALAREVFDDSAERPLPAMY
jgi:amidase